MAAPAPGAITMTTADPQISSEITAQFFTDPETQGTLGMEEEGDDEKEKWSVERSRVLDEWSEIELRGKSVLKMDDVQEPGTSGVGVEMPLEMLFPLLSGTNSAFSKLPTATSDLESTWGRVMRVCLCRPLPAALPPLAHTHKSLIISLSEVSYQNDNPTHWFLLNEYFKSVSALALNSTSAASQCPRVGPHWQIVGFQGSDPATDFRGCGILALLQLYTFSQRVPANRLKAIVQLSRKEPNDFPLAVVSINITGLILSQLKSGQLDSLATAEGAYPKFSALHISCLSFFCNEYKRLNSTLADCQDILSRINSTLQRNPSSVLAPLQQDVLL